MTHDTLMRTGLIAILAVVTGSPAHAAITTDASLGKSAQSLTGPNFTIAQSLGKLSGTNLFHSFQTFNILSGETANFVTNTPGITNVISRVTGGTLSKINGKLSLTQCPGCLAPNLFFINPAGITFGAGSTINVPGAFHVSTANYLKFGNEFFYANPAQASTFSVASPSAFGFLGTTRATITANAGATVQTLNPRQPISIIAGDISINAGKVNTQGGSDIRALATGLRTQEISLTGTLPAAYGNLEVLNVGRISSDTTSSTNAGSVQVSAANIAIDGGLGSSGISSSTSQGSGNAGSIDISATERISILNGGEISSSLFALSSGDAGHIRVNADNIIIDSRENPKFTGIASNANPYSVGSAGPINIAVNKTLSILNGGEISSSVLMHSSGNSGTIHVNAGNIIINAQGINRFTGIASQANTESAGSAGNLVVTVAKKLSLMNGGTISSSTFSSGNAGLVKVDAENILIDGGKQTLFTGIASKTETGRGDVGGDAGTLNITASKNISLLGGGRISSSTISLGKAGNITIATQSVVVDGRFSSIDASAEAASPGQTGSIRLNASGNITLSNGGEIAIRNDGNSNTPALLTPTLLSLTGTNITLIDAAITAASTGNAAASNIQISASNQLFIDPSVISTSALNASGGSIAINSGNLINLINSQITTSVLGTTGNGGNINISTGALVMSTGFIQANTAAANASGGTVGINVNMLIPTGSTLFAGGQTPLRPQIGIFGYNVIQAAAPTGLSGAIQITSPVLDVSGSLGGLYAQVVETGGLSRSPCQNTGGSSLAQSGRGGLPASARGLLRAEITLPTAMNHNPSSQQKIAMHPVFSHLGCS
jgi:filamentous hemagglutinin family protein